MNEPFGDKDGEISVMTLLSESAEEQPFVDTPR